MQKTPYKHTIALFITVVIGFGGQRLKERFPKGSLLRLYIDARKIKSDITLLLTLHWQEYLPLHLKP